MSHAKQHFSKTVADYDTVVSAVVLENDRMHEVAVDALCEVGLPRGVRVLDIGCGTGHSMELVLDRCPDAFVEGVDFSGRMIERAAVRLERFAGRFALTHEDCLKLEYQAESFDAIFSAVTIHNLSSRDKQTLFCSIAQWLRPGGVFVNADFYRGETEGIQRQLLELYLRHVRQHLSGEELEVWLEHIHTDDPLRLSELQNMLTEQGAGNEALCDFSIVWLYGNQAVTRCRKPG